MLYFENKLEEIASESFNDSSLAFEDEEDLQSETEAYFVEGFKSGYNFGEGVLVEAYDKLSEVEHKIDEILNPPADKSIKEVISELRSISDSITEYLCDVNYYMNKGGSLSKIASKIKHGI